MLANIDVKNANDSNQPAATRNRANSTTRHDVKICVGDRVKVTTADRRLKDKLGAVLYIGYAYPGRGIRYGVNLLHSTKGQNNGCLMLDIKTGKLAKVKHIHKYRKHLKKRKFFKAKNKHGIFLRKEEIVTIERRNEETIDGQRGSSEDTIKVKFRGEGTIKFVGSLQHTKEMGVWYGIQLKDRRGRHDGTVNGVKYFECPPQYGLHCRFNHLEAVAPKLGALQEATSLSRDLDDLPASANAMQATQKSVTFGKAVPKATSTKAASM